MSSHYELRNILLAALLPCTGLTAQTRTTGQGTATAPTIAVSPTTLQFVYTLGGAVPGAQSVQITNTGGGTLVWGAGTGNAFWLAFTPSSGTAPSTLSVSVIPQDVEDLNAGTYTGSIVIGSLLGSSGNATPVSIAVTLTVAHTAAVLAVSPYNFNFNYTAAGKVPPAQNAFIANVGGGTMPWSASSTAAAWLQVSPSSGTGDGVLSISVNPTGLAPRPFAAYSANVVITAPGASGSPSSIAVFIVVQPAVNIAGVANGASFQPAFATATWVSIFGTSLTSQSTGTWQSTDFVGGLLPTSLGGVSVTINGLPAYVEYISTYQINVLVPDDPTIGAVQIQVTTPEGISNSFTAQKQQFAPAFFTVNGTGTSYVAALHADYSPVGVTQPAKPGETILLYATGFGPTNPILPTGYLVSTPAALANTATVTIGGISAVVAYAGLVGSGLYQLNVTVPDLPDGDAAVLASVGGVQSQAGVLVSIQQ